MSPTVACVGLAVLDTVFTLPGPLNVGLKQVAQSAESRVGGLAANASAAVSALGGHARLITKVGIDPAGEQLVAKLGAFGVGDAYVRRIDRPTSTSTVIITPDGERTIVNHTVAAINDESDLPMLADLDGCHSVLVDVRWPAAALHAGNLARQIGIPCVVDADVAFAGEAMELLDIASHVILSEPALEASSGERNVEAALLQVDAAARAFVGVTLGQDGFAWVQDGQVQRAPGIYVSVVNTSGAGDVFHGAFALGLAEGLDTESNALRSNAAGAFSCASPEASARFASTRDIRSLLKTHASRRVEP